MSQEQLAEYTPESGLSLFPEHIWDKMAPPKTPGQFAGRFDTLQYAIRDASTPDFNNTAVIESAHRAIQALIEQAPAGGLDIRRIKDYIAERKALEADL